MVLAMLALKEQLKSRAKLFMIKLERRWCKTRPVGTGEDLSSTSSSSPSKSKEKLMESNARKEYSEVVQVSGSCYALVSAIAFPFCHITATWRHESGCNVPTTPRTLGFCQGAIYQVWASQLGEHWQKSHVFRISIFSELSYTIGKIASKYFRRLPWRKYSVACRYDVTGKAKLLCSSYNWPVV